MRVSRNVLFVLGLAAATLTLTSCGGGGATGGGGIGGTLGSVSFDIAGAAQEPVTSFSNATVITGIAGAEFTGIQVTDRFLHPILYTTNENGIDTTYVMLPTTGARTPLNGNETREFYERDPQISPAGNVVSYTTDSQGTTRIVLHEIGGSGIVLDATSPSANDSQAVWLPEYRGLFYVSDSDGNKEIWSMDGNGGDRTKYTSTGTGVINEAPALSPDGKRVAFVSTRDGNREIYVMSTLSGLTTRLTNNAGADDNPEWSPNGEKIVFQSDRSGNNDIYTMNSYNGNLVTRLTTDVNQDTQPTYSYDGTKIYFSSTRDDTAAPISTEIYSMLINGTSQTRLPIDSSYSQQSPTMAKNWTLPIANLRNVLLASSGFILGQTNTVTTSIVLFDCVNSSMANRALTRVVSNIPGGTSVSNLMFTIKTDTGLLSVVVLSFPPGGVSIFPEVLDINVQGSSTNALVTYSAAGTTAGQVVSVVPYGANRSGMQSKTENGVITVTGSFDGLFDGKGKSLAAGGVSELRYDEKTGALLSYK